MLLYAINGHSAYAPNGRLFHLREQRRNKMQSRFPRQRRITSGVAIGKAGLHVPSRVTRAECRLDASHDGRSARWSAYGTSGGHRARSEGTMKCGAPLDNTACATHSPLPLFQDQVFGARAWVSIRNLTLRRVHARFLERMCVHRLFVRAGFARPMRSSLSAHVLAATMQYGVVSRCGNRFRGIDRIGRTWWTETHEAAAGATRRTVVRSLQPFD